MIRTDAIELHGHRGARCGRGPGAAGAHLCGLVLALGVAAACGPGAAPSEVRGEPACEALRLEAPPPAVNVVIVLADTLRRDAPGIYGGRAPTPRFDRFARRNLLFERAVSQAPWTKPSVATLFTALHPSQHGVESDPQVRRREDVERRETLAADVLAPGLITLAEVLRGAGFRTAAFISNPWLERRFGFDQGFEHYDDSLAHWHTPGGVVTRAALAWIAEQPPEARWLVYVHYMDPHLPYGPLPRAEVATLRARLNADPRPTGPGAEELVGLLTLDDGTPVTEAGFRPTRALFEAAYDAGVARFDRAFGRLLRGLRRSPAWPQTALIVTSDHGEGLFEKGYGNHGARLWDAEVLVPMAARLPGVEPRQARIDCGVGLVDVLPTLCTYLGVECPEGMAGWSFVRGERPAPEGRRHLVSEGVMKQPSHRAIRNRRFKLTFEPDYREERGKRSDYALYDVVSDPAETRDLAEAPRDARDERVFEALEEAIPEAVAPRIVPEQRTAPIDPELSDRLRELGYLEEEEP